MTSHPTGTVTFLFTDIEGSTRLWENHHDDMAEAVSAHDRLIRQTVATYDGFRPSTSSYRGCRDPRGLRTGVAKGDVLLI